MITRSVPTEDIDGLHLVWNSHINASVLYRCALREEMAVRDVDPHKFRTLLERVHEQGYTLDESIDKTTRYVDLQSLVEEPQGQRTAGNTTHD